MKLALFVCVALLAVLLQADEETSPPIRREGTRISGGRPAMPRQFPFLAYIKREDPSDWPFECTGSLITRNAVLTSAACVYWHKKHTVRLGSVYRTGDDPNAWTAVSIVSLSHPNFNADSNHNNNVGIVFLPRKAPLNDYIQPVDLPSSPDVGSFVGSFGIVSGWGETSLGSGPSDVLHWGEVVVLQNDVCAKFFPKERVTDSRICAGCQTVMDGDDGAPLVLKTKVPGTYLQIGIHCLREREYYNASLPAIYERVTSHLEWIRSVTGLH